MMSLRSFGLLLLLTVGACLSGCTGGSTTPRLPTPQCSDPGQKFCLISCNLGCSVSGGCRVTEIAQNQSVVLTFSQNIDPNSVTNTSVSLKTPNGESPFGRFFVDGTSLVFQPEARLVGGSTEFGFRTQETYVLSLLSGSPAALRSVSGNILAAPLVCTLSVTQGLIDLDGQPPTAELLLPQTTTDVDPGSAIVVRFSELVDTSNFGINTQVSPIQYTLSRADVVNGVRTCPGGNRGSTLIQGVPVASVEIDNGVPRTVVTLQPAVDLPSGSCVFVLIEAGAVHDVAGTPGAAALFKFTVVASSSGPETLTETFANDQRLDRTVSGGTWTGGVGTPATLGGRGVHGSFTPSDGVSNGTGTFVWDTDMQTIPSERALFGTSRPEFLQVTDGQFEFTDFVVPSGVRVRFKGSKPAVIRVRGEVRIDGEVHVDGGVSNVTFNPAPTLGTGGMYIPNPGESPVAGGAGGGAGGHGAVGADGVTPLPANAGQPGEDLVVPAGSGYVGHVAGTGGHGGPLFPASGLRSSVTFTLFSALSGQLAGGGGGGDFLGGATGGAATQSYGAGDLGPSTTPGTATTYRARPMGVSSLDHYTVGGSGGGGGGSQPLDMGPTDVNTSMKPWNAGASGCGGGGAIAIRAGGSLTVGGPGVVSCRGGGGLAYSSTNGGLFPSPGGAGSGGSILLQVENSGQLSLGGLLDVRGGAANTLHIVAFAGLGTANATSGAGGRGYVRVEADGVTMAQVGQVQPAAASNTNAFGSMDDQDDYSGFASLWRSTRQVFQPGYVNYRLVARIAGQSVTFTDSTLPGEFNPANRDDLPLRVYIQGGPVNASNDQLEGVPSPWVDFVNPDAGPSIGDFVTTGNPITGFRFMIIFNRAVESDVVVEEFSVTYQP